MAEHGLGLNIGLHGEDGLELRTYWKSIAGPQSYLGLSVPKFPNYFMVVGPNAIAGSWGYTIGNQVRFTSCIALTIDLSDSANDQGNLLLQPEVYTASRRRVPQTQSRFTATAIQ